MSMQISEEQQENLAEQWNTRERIRVIQVAQREAQSLARAELAKLNKKLLELDAEYRSGCFQAVLKLDA